MSQFWLMKSEPDVFSFEQLKKDKTTWWTGVRNYQARNFMMNQMKIGDTVLFYHSNAEPPGIAGLAKVTRLAQPDPTQFDKKSEYFDPKATKEKPIWFCVEVGFHQSFKNYLPLPILRDDKKLAGLLLLQKGTRLSITPVDQKHFDHIVTLGQSS
jgi:predicted RNA-binding protein with PUA-like domain